MHSHFTLSFIGASSYPLRTHPLRSYPLRASSSLRPRFLHHRSFFHRRRSLHRSVHDLITDSNCHSLVILIHRFRYGFAWLSIFEFFSFEIIVPVLFRYGFRNRNYYTLTNQQTLATTLSILLSLCKLEVQQLESSLVRFSLWTCIYRKKTRRGSSAFMEKEIPFIGILSNKAEQNPGLLCGEMKVVKCSNPDSCKLV
ncbi:hypothetical protein Ahy_A06g028578 [Arachis hypogaea]|uniref:Pectin acetylesterase n=1 Tax=Arachis hypogaea TaxID=3818 RepID=A0A445CRE6_ARAHY|nr:hypothetical protein Ahy_A06g028578 [Arachis hypogaea]